MQIEHIIIKSLLGNENYTRKVLPFLKEEYFQNDSDKVLFDVVQKFITAYNVSPSVDEISVELGKKPGLYQDTLDNAIKTLENIKANTDKNHIDWLTKSTEEFCQEKAIYNAIMNSIEILNNKSKLTKGAIPGLLSDALSVSFDPNVGHDYLEQSDSRFDYYHRVEEKLPFDLEFLNNITKGGIPNKTLNIIMGGVHSGKSLFLCHFASAYLNQGKNVLYISLEMSEEEIAKRIDANLLNISFDDLMVLPKALYDDKVSKLKQKTNGKLIIKEYPSTSASVLHFKALLNELSLKKDFVPDVILIDYLNICASSRIKASSANDTYTYVKSIAEEVRGLAQEFGIPIWSATQLTRTGYSSSDPDMTDVAESFGLPATCDLLLVLIVSEQMKQMNQIMIKQLKNRYDDMNRVPRGVVGVDKTKMKLFDLLQTEQKNVVHSGASKSSSQSPQVNKFKALKV